MRLQPVEHVADQRREKPDTVTARLAELVSQYLTSVSLAFLRCRCCSFVA
jgi:hypothetical protein